MKGKTGFFKIFITSIYDINVFSQYAKEGIIKAVTYILPAVTFFVISSISNIILGSIGPTLVTASIK